jgi:hypothetical protein
MREAGTGSFRGHRPFLALLTGDSLSRGAWEKVLLALLPVLAAFPEVPDARRAPEAAVARAGHDLPGRLPAL